MNILSGCTSCPSFFNCMYHSSDVKTSSTLKGIAIGCLVCKASFKYLKQSKTQEQAVTMQVCHSAAWCFRRTICKERITTSKNTDTYKGIVVSVMTITHYSVYFQQVLFPYILRQHWVYLYPFIVVELDREQSGDYLKMIKRRWNEEGNPAVNDGNNLRFKVINTDQCKGYFQVFFNMKTSFLYI